MGKKTGGLLDPTAGGSDQCKTQPPALLDPSQADTTIPPARSGIKFSIPVPKAAPLPKEMQFEELRPRRLKPRTG